MILFNDHTMKSTLLNFIERRNVSYISHFDISIHEPDNIEYITAFTAQAQVFHGTFTMTLVIPIMITMLSGERINCNNSSILETSIMIMIIIMVNNHNE